MSKSNAHPILLDEVLKISISTLSKSGYLKQGQKKRGEIKWAENASSILIQIDTQNEKPYIELNYKYRDEYLKYNVYLTSIPSNLNRGEVWFFVCPISKMRCRKLYLINGYFLHREAYKGCMYQIQTQSKKIRQVNKTLGALISFDESYNQLHQKYFREKYAGKPTRNYLKLLKKINSVEGIQEDELKRLLS